MANSDIILAESLICFRDQSHTLQHVPNLVGFQIGVLIHLLQCLLHLAQNGGLLRFCRVQVQVGHHRKTEKENSTETLQDMFYIMFYLD